VDPDQPFFGHEASDPFLATALIESPQLRVDPGCAIGGPRAPVDLGDQGGELGIPRGTVRWRSSVPRVVARPGDVENPTEPLDPVLTRVLGDEPEAAHRVVSLAK
jgi:hypothetical protein